ncbi:MAG: hypothetical protein DMF71_11230 [Acidobacteria bacterium]|nr:MAG: hypothetical protein DMF71_11230 [Acidobacteriota bacterium]
MSEAATDLMSKPGTNLVLAGPDQPVVVQLLTYSINSALKNLGATLVLREFPRNPKATSILQLASDINEGRVKQLFILGGDPVYSAHRALVSDRSTNLPLDWADLQKKVPEIVRLGYYEDATSELSHWHIPAAHYLESWGDTRSYDGTVTIVQPLIAPLYEGKTAHEVLSLFGDNYDRKPYDIVKDYWRAQAGTGRQGREVSTESGSDRVTNAQSPTKTNAPADFDSWWRKCLHDGFFPNSALPTKTVSLKSDWANALSRTNADRTSALPAQSGSYEIVFRPDPTIYDGRFSNNGWLQELPKPLTKLTWDNVALVSPNTAKKMGVLPPNYEKEKKGGQAFVDTIKLSHRGSNISQTVPVWVMPGQPDDVITIHLGYGRGRAGRIGDTVGFNAYEIRYSDESWAAVGAEVSKTNEQYQLAATQIHFQMEGRDLLRESSLAEYLKDKDRLREEREQQQKELHDMSLYPDFDYKNQGNGYAWGMSIDLNSCVGCNACALACQAENNIPIVGKEQVSRSREMNWIRIDAYYKGDEYKPEGPYFQPVPCMHCENAPCEPVCPVHATAHSSEGLNEMVYNRCVGTRYCSDNCPYKVRRFNFLLYQDWETPTYQLMRNPDVSVRSRGVMEKCTYCVQRIQAAKIQSEIEGRPVRDGEIVTACQSVCPTEAIVFGNINDPNSKVSKLKALERDYSLLGDLNTRPRTTYLSALRNPNPEIKA